MSDEKIVLDSSDIDRAKSKIRELINELDKLGGESGKATGSIREMATAAMGMGTPLVILAGVATAISTVAVGMAKLAFQSIQAADAMNDMSNRTNIATERLTLLDTMARMAGSSAEALVSSSERLAMKLARQDEEGGKAVTALKELGISTKNANGETKSMILLQEEIVLAVDKSTNQAKAQGAAVQLLGAEYYKLKTPIKEAALGAGEMYDMLFKTNALISTNLAKSSDDFNDKISTLGKTFTGMGNTIAEVALPILNTFASKLVSIGAEAAKLMKQFAGLDATHNAKTAIDKTYEDEAKAKQQLALYTGRFGPANEAARKNAQSTLDGIYDVRRKIQDEALKIMRAEDDAKTAAVKGAAGEGNAVTGKDKPYKPEKVKATPVPKMETLSLTNEFVKQTDSIIKLNEEYNRMYGVQEQTSLQMVNAAISLGKYNGLNNEGVRVKKAASAADLETLRTNARIEDAWKVTLESKKEEIRIRREAAEVADRLNSAEADNRSARVMMEYGKTTNDAALAVNAYSISLNNTALMQERLSKEERDALVQKGKMLEADKTSLEQKIKNGKALKDEQRTFSYGWDQAFKKYQDDAGNAATSAQTLFNKATSSMEDGLTQFVTTGKLSFGDLAKSIINDLIKMEARAAASGMMKMLIGAASSYFGGDATGGGMTATMNSAVAGGWTPSANGNVFSGAGLLMSAKGNVFDTPTLHGYAGGMGMLGEAGPEAIMPLSRGANGKLGVVASGAGGGGNSTQNTYSISVNVQNVDSNERLIELQRELRNTIIATTKETMANESRKGGMLNPVR